MPAKNLKQRVAALESEIAQLRAQVGVDNSGLPWWERIAESFKGDRAYKKAMELGREYRESQRPKPRKRRKQS